MGWRVREEITQSGGVNWVKGSLAKRKKRGFISKSMFQSEQIKQARTKCVCRDVGYNISTYL